MNLRDFSRELVPIILCKSKSETDEYLIKVNIGKHLYDVESMSRVIDMDANKPNIVIHVKDK